MLGLISVIDHFDPARKVRLHTYAEYRIRGAILDAVRHDAPMSRKRSDKSVAIERARAALAQRLSREATSTEIAAHLRITLEKYYAWQLAVDECRTESLEAAPGRLSFASRVADDRSPSPSDLAERVEGEELLNKALARIPARQRSVIVQYYRESRTFADIARCLGLTPAAVWALRNTAVERLKTVLTGFAPQDHGPEPWCGVVAPGGLFQERACA